MTTSSDNHRSSLPLTLTHNCCLSNEEGAGSSPGNFEDHSTQSFPCSNATQSILTSVFMTYFCDCWELKQILHLDDELPGPHELLSGFWTVTPEPHLPTMGRNSHWKRQHLTVHPNPCHPTWMHPLILGYPLLNVWGVNACTRNSNMSF